MDQGGGIDVLLRFVTGAFCIFFCCHGAWALVLSSAPVRAVYAAGRRWAEAALGRFLAFAAYRLASSAQSGDAGGGQPPTAFAVVLPCRVRSSSIEFMDPDGFAAVRRLPKGRAQR